MPENTNVHANKTTLLEKLGYGSGSFGDAASYSFISVFLSFFLTTVAGLPPGIAGTIAAVGSVWNAVWNPIMGYLADKVATHFGRRRPLIFAFAIPLAIVMVLLYTAVPLPDSIKPIYYGLMLMLYWTFYTGYFVPYLALGADYTQDYDDRTVLRLVSSLFNMLGNATAMVFPTILVDMLERAGFTTGRAWSFAALILGSVSALSILITVFASAKFDPPCANPSTASRSPSPYPFRGNTSYCRGGCPSGAVAPPTLSGEASSSGIFREYLSVAKLKPAAPVILTSLAALCCFTLIVSNLSYYLSFNFGFSAGQVSLALLTRSLLSIVFIPIVGRLVLRFDKKATLISAYILGSAILVIVRFIALPPFAKIALYMVGATLCTSIYWQVMPGVFYDIAEYDRIENGKNRTATIVSFQGLVEAFAAGIGGQLLGLILQFAGFNGSLKIQSPTALLWIENAATIVPIAFAAITCLAFARYPLTRKVYEELINKDSAKNAADIEPRG